MTFDLNGFQVFLDEAESANRREHEAIQTSHVTGMIRCTPREAGCFLPPDTPARIMNEKSHWRYTNTPEGHAAWEKSSLETQARLRAMVEDSKPAKTKPETFKLSDITITR